MQILPLKTRLLSKGDNLALVLAADGAIKDGDTVVISSKVIAMTESGTLDLTMLTVTDEARIIAETTKQDPRFIQAILEELKRLDGTIVNLCPGAVLTEVHPGGTDTSILIANAGLDQSNAGKDMVIGWPKNPVQSARELRSTIERAIGGRIGLIVSDSCSLPRRKGVVAIALAVSGIDPLHTQEGQRDLFDRHLQMTTEATADQLATAANAVMGNAAQSTAAAIIRDHGIPFSGFEGWVPGIPRNEDLFR